MDVSDYEALYDCIAHFVLDHGGVLNGCIHAAGVQQDGLILNQSDTAIETALSAKVIGTLNLDRATINYPLDHFSSAVFLLIDIGQHRTVCLRGC